MLVAEGSAQMLPIKDSSQRFSREADPMPGLVSRFVLRLESFPKSKVAKADILESVKFPEKRGDEATVLEKYRSSSFPGYIMAWIRAFKFRLHLLLLRKTVYLTKVTIHFDVR